MDLRLKEIRTLRNMTQKEVGDKLGCSSVVYSRYETGAREPSLDVLVNLADLFGVSVDFIVGREEIESGTLNEYETILIEHVRKASAETREDIMDFLIIKEKRMK